MARAHNPKSHNRPGHALQDAPAARHPNSPQHGVGEGQAFTAYGIHTSKAAIRAFGWPKQERSLGEEAKTNPPRQTALPCKTTMWSKTDLVSFNQPPGPVPVHSAYRLSFIPSSAGACTSPFGSSKAQETASPKVAIRAEVSSVLRFTGLEMLHLRLSFGTKPTSSSLPSKEKQEASESNSKPSDPKEQNPEVHNLEPH